MQIKTAIKYYLTSVRIDIIKKSKSNKCWRGCGEKGTLLHCWWECKCVCNFRNSWILTKSEAWYFIDQESFVKFLVKIYGKKLWSTEEKTTQVFLRIIFASEFIILLLHVRCDCTVHGKEILSHFFKVTVAGCQNWDQFQDTSPQLLCYSASKGYLKIWRLPRRLVSGGTFFDEGCVQRKGMNKRSFSCSSSTSLAPLRCPSSTHSTPS